MYSNVIKIALMLLGLASPTASFARASGLETPITNSRAVESNAALGAAISTAEMFDPDVTTSGALDRGATESLSRSGRDRSNTNLIPSDPRIGQNPRDAMGSIDKVDRSDRNSVINRNRW
jgi:hypothetical protein